ncbi:hypothetical protein EZS27_028065 [termite gut metagenome]|uniref:Uncharacterized protein n=1 Tax=termite gut metagenome TaxID=433724 RepID=A0A5J4QN93_9ZZZZ
METKPNSCNPRTEKQQAQRVQLTNLVTTYQTLSSFIRGAYSSKPKNLSDYNMFIKENLSSRVKVYLDKTEASRKGCIVAPYNISEGKLPSIETVVQGDVLRTSLRAPRSFQITDETTAEEVSLALLQANPQLQKEDQISILHLVQHAPSSSEGGVPYMTLKQYDFILDTDSYSASRFKFYENVPKSLFRVNEGHIQTEAGIETGGIAILIALVLIFGITIASQNNTTREEKTYTQREVDLMMQVKEQERKMSEMQKEIDLLNYELLIMESGKWKVGFNTEARRFK